jgi:hypothetical protein
MKALVAVEHPCSPLSAASRMLQDREYYRDLASPPYYSRRKCTKASARAIKNLNPRDQVIIKAQ